MKNYIYLFAIAAFSLAACTKAENVIPGEGPGNVPAVAGNTISFTCEYPVPSSESEAGVKTTIDDQGHVSWEEGDEITVYYLHGGEPQNVPATAINTGQSSTFTATLPDGHDPDHFWAVYPAGRGTLTNEGGNEQFSLTLGRTDGSFKAANLMAAYTTDDAMTFAFKNAVGIVRLALPTGGAIAHGDDTYIIKTVRLKGQETSIVSLGDAVVNISSDAVSGYTYSDKGTKSATVDLTDEVRASGYAYIPSYPGVLTDGFAIRYFSDEGNIPAVLTKATVSYSIVAGHIKPLADLSGHIVWDFYVSADGAGDGLSETNPMSLADLQTMLDAGSKMYGANLINGTTVHFAAGDYTLTSELKFPTFPEATHVLLEGNGAVLDGNAAVRVLNLTGNNKKLQFKNFTFKNGLNAAKGAGIYAIPGNNGTDANFVVDFENCLISGNTVTSGYGAGLAIDGPGTATNTSGGILRFNNCRFENNVVSNGQAGAVYLAPNCGTAAMFNKCTFMGNTATTNTYTIGVNCSGTEDVNHGRLAMNNCTVNTGNKVFSSNGSSLTLKGYSVIVNSTIWGSGETGKWGTLALGANRVAQGLDANAASVINCIIRNKSNNYKGLYLHGSYYQNIKNCLYTGLTEAGNATATGEDPTYSISNSADISSTVEGAAAKTQVINGITAYYYQFTQDYSSDISFPTLEQVRAAIEGTTSIGPLFLSWLDTIEGSLTTDLIGQERPADASHPGSWQKQ